MCIRYRTGDATGGRARRRGFQPATDADATFDGEANTTAGGTARGAETARGRTTDAPATASAVDDAVTSRRRYASSARDYFGT